MNELRRTQSSERGRPHTKSLSVSVVHAEDELGPELAGTRLPPHTQPCPKSLLSLAATALPGCDCYQLPS